MERKATVVHTDFPQDRRVLAISDVHGNLPFLRGVLDKAGYGEDDILVLVGDLVEKGPDSLATLRYVMELARTRTVYALRGNCDNLVEDFTRADGEIGPAFYRHYLKVWGERSLICQMAVPRGSRCARRKSCLPCARCCAGTLRRNWPSFRPCPSSWRPQTTCSSTAACREKRGWRSWRPGPA